MRERGWMGMVVRRAAACLGGACLVAVGPSGCAPEGYETIDMNASKAIAAEKGMGPGQPGQEAAKKPKGRPSVPTTAPAAPAPR